MFKHLLIPLDGSQLAEAALPAALELAARFNSELTLLQVVRPPYISANLGGAAYSELLLKMREAANEEAQIYLKAQQGSLRQQGYIVHVHQMEGDGVAEAIMDAVQGLSIDAIVMSTHGRGGIRRWVFGSVADKVLQRALVPVLLIRTHEGFSGDWRVESRE